MYCRKCGAKNIDQAKFCAKCGNSLVNNQPQVINDEKANTYSNKVVDSNEVADSDKAIGTNKNKSFTVIVIVLTILCLAAVGVIAYKVLINKYENSKVTAGNSIDSKDKAASSTEDALKSPVVPEKSVIKEADSNSNSNSNSNSVSSSGDNQVTEESKTSSLDQKELSMIGTINSNLNLHMKLSFNKNEVSGTYYYDKYSTESLNLKGVYDKDSNVVMNELDSNGGVTGVFTGVISSSGTFTGNWSSPDGTKKFPFVINPSN